MNGIIRPGDEFESVRPDLRNAEGRPARFLYSFDQLTVDVITQIDNMTVAMHAVDGLTNTGLAGQAVINAHAVGTTGTTATAGTGGTGNGAPTGTGTASNRTADIKFAPGTFCIDKASADAIGRSLV